MRTAIIVGGGISGIAAAHRLRGRGFTPCVLEAEPALGGRIGARLDGSAEVDLGGRNFSAGAAPLIDLLRAFGITDLVDYRFSSVSVGTARPFDATRGGGALAGAGRFLANLAALPPAQLLRLQGVARTARRAPDANLLGSPYWVELAERTSDPTVASYFGAAAAGKVLRPWTLRMMASEPDEVYLGNLGPMLGSRSGTKRVAGGMGRLLRAVGDAFETRLAHRVTSVVLDGGRVAGVAGVDPAGRAFSEHAEVVVLATPATAAADLLEAVPDLARELRRIAYRPVATIVAHYSDAAFARGAAGYFLPRGCTTCHIARYDADHRVRFSFAGVAARPAFDAHSLDGLLELGEAEFRRFGGRLGRRLSHIGQLWRPGLCGHSWMHHRTLRAIRASCAGVPGLVLTGDYFRGNLLEACVRASYDNIDAIDQLAAP
jgi:oxygen-dependent protoporphyrinogen oxidase